MHVIQEASVAVTSTRLSFVEVDWFWIGDRPGLDENRAVENRGDNGPSRPNLTELLDGDAR